MSPRPDTASALKWLGAAATILSVTLGGRQLVNAYGDRREKREAVGRHLAAAEVEQGAGSFDAAWTHLDSAARTDARDLRTRRARERLAMRWLDELQLNGTEGDLAAAASRLSQPVAEGIGTATGRDRADLLAHLAAATVLRRRFATSQSGADSLLRRALADDPANPFAHALLGMLALSRGTADLPTAREHFDSAAASGRETAFVRRVRFASLLNASTYVTGASQELIRTADAVRRAGGSIDAGTRRSIYSYAYYSQMRDSALRARTLAALPPENHLATFRWMYARDLADSTSSSAGVRAVAAMILESAGRRDDAIAEYRLVRATAPGSSFADEAAAALARLRAR